MPITTGYQALMDKAMREVRTYSVQETQAKIREGSAQLVDIRDIRELEIKGRIANSIHAPRGMLEFWVDPASPYYKESLGNDKVEYILFCAVGWRSALAVKTLQDMGMHNVAHIGGGFNAWCKEDAQIEPPKSKNDQQVSTQGWWQRIKGLFS